MKVFVRPSRVTAPALLMRFAMHAVGAVCTRLSAPARLAIVAAFGVLALQAAPLNAQVSTGSVEGVITTADSATLANTIVLLLRSDLPRDRPPNFPDSFTTRTGANGRFVIRGLTPANYSLVVRRPGFAQSVTPVVVTAAQATRVSVQLNVATLETVEISARRSDLPDVAEREARGMGVVIYAEEIEKLPVYSTQDILQFYPRFSLGQLRRIIMVDGRPIRGSWEIPHKLDIAAMEAQRGFIGVNEPDLWMPDGVSRSTGATVLLIWTKPYIGWLRQEEEKRRVRDSTARADSLSALPDKR